MWRPKEQGKRGLHAPKRTGLLFFSAHTWYDIPGMVDGQRVRNRDVLESRLSVFQLYSIPYTLPLSSLTLFLISDL